MTIKNIINNINININKSLSTSNLKQKRYDKHNETLGLPTCGYHNDRRWSSERLSQLAAHR